jgi:hypothetical protein
MKGPFVIVGRAHSGTRLLAGAFLRAGFWMGPDSDRESLDSKFFSLQKPAIRFLMQEAFHYAELGSESQEQMARLMRSLVHTAKRRCPDPEHTPAFGWKRPGSAFLVELLLDAIPEAKVVHLIRDGRDVMLSRVERPFKYIDDPFHRLLVFGDANRSRYCGQRITPELVDEHRDELEMEHWVTTVRAGMRGRRFGGRYLEVRYEDLCREPADCLPAIFTFLGVDLPGEVLDWLVASATTDRVGKWRERQAELRDAIAVGEPLLTELGYSSAAPSQAIQT